MKSVRCAIAVLSLGAIVACGGDSTGPSDTIVGTYALVTLKGLPLPVNPVRPGDPTANGQYITADTLVLHADYTFRWITVYDFPPLVAGDVDETSTDSATGTYALRGTTVLLTWAVDPASTTPGEMTGTAGNGVITMSYWDSGFPAIYWKQSAADPGLGSCTAAIQSRLNRSQAALTPVGDSVPVVTIHEGQPEATKQRWLLVVPSGVVPSRLSYEFWFTRISGGCQVDSTVYVPGTIYTP